MYNILLTLILPFVPIWSYGHVAGLAQSQSPAACNSEAAAVCPIDPQVLGEQAGPKDDNSPEKKSGFDNYNIFPIDHAQAASIVPVRMNNLPDLKLWAGSSVSIDVDSGNILHYDDGRKRTQIASLTKMMTAVLAVEKIKDLDESVTIQKEALNLVGTIVGCPTSTFCNGNRMYAGEDVRAKDLLKATLMNSANDAAAALAIHVAGSEKKFVGMMNEKAASLGLKDTHFCTASGLELDGQEDQCYSSAYDIARIAAYSLRHEVIWDIMKIPEGRFYSTDGKYMHELKNTDLLLETLPNCIGGKTGFTPLAGKSLLLGATDATGKHKIISVLLNDENRWEDMKILVDWINQNYSWR
ncbi:MAG: hypothetical protein WC238_04985 [Parcubacteria group bacterium]|jgi:D-alanyl-D-alanine carboxypeptidase